MRLWKDSRIRTTKDTSRSYPRRMIPLLDLHRREKSELLPNLASFRCVAVSLDDEGGRSGNPNGVESQFLYIQRHY